MGWIPTGTFAIPQKTSEFAKKTPNQQKVLKLTLSFGDIYTIKQKHPIQQLKESFDSWLSL